MRKTSRLNSFDLFPLFLALYDFVVNSSNGMYLPMLPTLAAEFGAKDSQVQRTVSIWLMGAAFLQLILGPLADRKGRKFVLLLGGALFLSATLGCTLVSDLSALLFFRFLQGVGVCTLTVCGYGSIHETYEEKRALKLLAVLGALSEIAPMIGPIIAGWVLVHFGWRANFYALTALGTLILWGLATSMPESQGKLDPHALHPGRLIRRYLRILRGPAFVLCVLSYGFLYAGLTAWGTSAPFLLMNHFNLSPKEYGVAQVPTCIAYISATLTVKRLVNTFSIEEIILTGLSVSLLGAVCFLLSSVIWPNSLFGVLFSMCIYCIGCGLSFSSFNRKSIFSSTESLGAVTAIQNLGMIGIAAFGSFLASVIFSGKPSSVGISMLSMISFAWIINWFRTSFLKKIRIKKDVDDLPENSIKII